MITKTLLRTLVTTWLAACVVTACQSPKAKSTSEGAALRSTRNNCYSLLHQLLDDEKDVSLLRFIKRERGDVKSLVKRIATASRDGAKMLEQLAKQDPSINLEDVRLPPGETSTRDAIAATKKHELLHQKGDDFELSLLLSQAEALRYASHLAKVASQNEPQPDRAQTLSRLSGQMENLYHEVFGLLTVREKSRAAAN